MDRDERLAALWLQGSLAEGGDDALSDIDAYIAVADDAFEAVFADRLALLEKVGAPLAWSDATTPGLRGVHALLAGPVKIDLFFERASQARGSKRPAARVLTDKADVTSAFDLTWRAPREQIAVTASIMIRMARQGALWPLRTLMRGQFSTFAMMELDLINKEIALMMALQRDAKHLYTNPFSLSRHLSEDQRARLDALTADALAGLHARDLVRLRDVHLRVYDALVGEARRACAALSIAYPLADSAEADLRALLARDWPSAPW